MRNYSLDILRFAACMCVILLHTVGVPLSHGVTSPSYLLLVLSVIGHYGVPIFVMVTGALLLDPNKSIGFRKLYFRYIARIVSAGVFWCAFYGTFHLMIYGIPFHVFPLGNQAYHLWYLPMILVVYSMVPVLRTIVNDHKYCIISVYSG